MTALDDAARASARPSPRVGWAKRSVPIRKTTRAPRTTRKARTDRMSARSPRVVTPGQDGQSAACPSEPRKNATADKKGTDRRMMPGWLAASPATDPDSGPLCRPEHRSGTRIRPRECLSAASCARPRGPREAQGTRRGRQRGGLSFGYFSLAGQRKVTRPAGAEKRWNGSLPPGGANRHSVDGHASLCPSCSGVTERTLTLSVLSVSSVALLQSSDGHASLCPSYPTLGTPQAPVLSFTIMA